MTAITIEIPDDQKLDTLGVFDWPIWECEVSTFDWAYEEEETCFILEGKVRVEPQDGVPIELRRGDLVTFPKGLACVWTVKEPVKKHYKFG